MREYTYITLRERPQLKEQAALWFHNKWNVPKEAYLECMEAYLNKETEYGCRGYEIERNYTYLFDYGSYRFL